MTKTKVKRSPQGWISEFGPVCCGRIVEVDGNRQPCVDFPGNPSDPVVARCLNTIGPSSRGLLWRLACLAGVRTRRSGEAHHCRSRAI